MAHQDDRAHDAGAVRPGGDVAHEGLVDLQRADRVARQVASAE